jgi:hypothetical protein
MSDLDPKPMPPIPGRPMVKCRGCGFNVEREDAYDVDPDRPDACTRCAKCRANPDMRESYRRGFNAGLDAMADAVEHAAKHSNLRKRRDDEDV